MSSRDFSLPNTGRDDSGNTSSRGSIRHVADEKQRDATLNIVRSQIDAIYDGNNQGNSGSQSTGTQTQAQSRQVQSQINQPMQNQQLVNGGVDMQTNQNQANYQPNNVAETDFNQPQTHNFHAINLDNKNENPYHKSHTDPSLKNSSNEEQWKQYHSAWQNYYQKYYETYYVNEVKKNLKNQKRHKDIGRTSVLNVEPVFGGVTTASIKKTNPKNDALEKLRQNIIEKAQTEATKVRKSRHFVPIAAALLVVAVFAFLQYNQVFIANVKAYMSPGLVESQNIIIDPNQKIPVDPSSVQMIIPKINVDAPIIYGVGPTSKDQLEAMRHGIAHVKYPNGANALPGQVGNAVFSAHSSSDWIESGKYKFIFVQLEKLTKDDVIYINYKGVRYSYKIFDTKTVLPSQIDALNYDAEKYHNKPIITLITCTPVGTSEKRFLVFAEQVSPDPLKAEKADESQKEEIKTSNMTGTTPTLIEKVFGF